MRQRPSITRRRVLALGALLALVGVAAACAPPKDPPPPPALAFPCGASPGSPVSGNDPLRSGWYPDQPGLNPSAGGQCAFGEQWSTAVDGQVYAAPLVDPARARTARCSSPPRRTTSTGSNAVTGQQLWHRSDLGVPWNPADLACNDLTPWVGITSTPAIDTDDAHRIPLLQDVRGGNVGRGAVQGPCDRRGNRGREAELPRRDPGCSGQRPDRDLRRHVPPAAPRPPADERRRVRRVRRTLRRPAVPGVGRGGQRHERRHDRAVDGRRARGPAVPARGRQARRRDLAGRRPPRQRHARRDPARERQR